MKGDSCTSWANHIQQNAEREIQTYPLPISYRKQSLIDRNGEGLGGKREKEEKQYIVQFYDVDEVLSKPFSSVREGLLNTNEKGGNKRKNSYEEKVLFVP